MVDQMATVDGAGGDEAQIPHGPPDGGLFEATGAYPWALIIQIIDANPLAIKRPLVESIASADMPVVHRLPLLRLQAQHVGNLLNAVISLQPGRR